VRWLCALVWAPLALLAVSPSSFSALRCSVSGLFIPETCCPALDDAPAPEDANRLPAVEAPGCCERVVVANAKAPAAGSTHPQLAAPERLPLLLSWAVLPEPPARVPQRPDTALRPPGRTAPAFLLTHAFLI
jgi:hypothetical protein